MTSLDGPVYDGERQQELEEQHRRRLHHARYLVGAFRALSYRASNLGLEHLIPSTGAYPAIARLEAFTDDDCARLREIDQWAAAKAEALRAEADAVAASTAQLLGYEPSWIRWSDAVEDAITVIHRMYAEITVEELRAAGQTLARGLLDAHAELARSEARSEDVRRKSGCQTQARGHRLEHGNALRDGRDGGGRRHYLAGKPVHSGDGMYLLLRQGWMPGRVETTRDGTPYFVCRPIPGADTEVSIELGRETRLAWPSELGAR